MRCGLLAIVLLVGLTTTEALYDKRGPVKILEQSNFQREVVDSNLVSLVEFYAPWCGHCQKLAPDFRKVAENLQGLVTVGAVDCDAESNKRLCSEYGIRGFPTIKIFPTDKQKNPYTGKYGKVPEDYNGPRSAKAMVDAAMAGLTDVNIKKLRKLSDLEALKETAGSLPQVVLVSSRDKATPLYKSLSLRFAGRAQFGEAHKSATDVVQQLGVTDLPALLVLKPDGEQVVYEGKLKPLALIEFLEGLVAPAPEGSTTPQGAKKEGKKAEKPPTPQVVQNLTVADMQELQENAAWLIGLFKGDESKSCAAEAAAFNELLVELGGLLRGGQVNLTAQPLLADFKYAAALEAAQPCQFVTVLVPYGDSSEDEWLLYEGERSAKAVQAAALEGFAGHPVARVGGEQWEQFMALGVAAPLVVLFTDKDATPPLFAALAANFAGHKYVFADVHSGEAAILSSMNIKKVPSIVVAAGERPSDASAAAPATPPRLQLIPYPGPMRYAHLHAFLEAMAPQLGALPEGAGGAAEPGVPRGGLGGQPPAQVAEVQDNAAFAERCGSKAGICLLALLDARDEALSEHLGAVQAVADKRHGQPALQFLWLDAPRQAAFLQPFGLDPSAAPTVLALSPRKLRFALLKGALGARALDDFVGDVLSGKVPTLALPSLPPLLDGGADPADPSEPGGAGEEAVVEEEFDLADIMGEEVAGTGLGTKEEQLRRVEQELQEEERAKQREAEEHKPKSGKSKKQKKGKKAKKSKDEL